MHQEARQSASLRWGRVVVGCALAVLASALARAATRPLGPSYPVSSFEISYALDHPKQLDPRDLLDLEVGLTAVGDTYTAPRPVDRTVRMRLSSLPASAHFTATAIQHIDRYIVSTLNRAGYNGVVVTVPDIDERTGRDLRGGGRTSLRLRVWIGRVARLTTLADGARFGSESLAERTDNTAHEWIRERSPVQPGGIHGLLDIRALEDYAARLSRQPGRRVDVELSAGPRPGTSDVNLRIAERRPWTAYAQYANTGTSATTKNRERFGLVDDQLLGRDDVLRLDYTTGDFREVHTASASYDSPFSLDAPGLRYLLRGIYSTFDASEVGFVGGRFLGSQILSEGNVRWNALQDGAFFLDLNAGTRYHWMQVENRQLGSRKDSASFWIPTVGVSGERHTRTSNLDLAVNVDYGISNNSQDQLETMGNPRVDNRFTLVRWDAGYSFYLEPLVDRYAWEDPGTPESSTLAHEVAMSVRGQWAVNARLVPQEQAIAGGLFTVRGYKQAAAAGDSAVIGSAEYRFHLPRALAPDPEPPQLPIIGRFRVRRESVFGNPDWDLILRLFTDAARVVPTRPNDTEQSETLFSWGAGVEMQLLQHLSLRFDGGNVLETVGSSRRGDIRGHVLATVVY